MQTNEEINGVTFIDTCDEKNVNLAEDGTGAMKMINACGKQTNEEIRNEWDKERINFSYEEEADWWLKKMSIQKQQMIEKGDGLRKKHDENWSPYDLRYNKAITDYQNLIKQDTHICCDGECNHDDCCGKVSENCPNYQNLIKE